METMAAQSRPNEPVGDFVLTLACPDRPGIVHAVTSFLMEHGGNIMESQQFGDQQAGRFFMRIDFEVDSPTSAETLRAGLRGHGGGVRDGLRAVVGRRRRTAR